MYYIKLLFLIMSFIPLNTVFCMEEKNNILFQHPLIEVKTIIKDIKNGKIETYHVEFKDYRYHFLVTFNPVNPEENKIQYHYAGAFRLINKEMLTLLFPTFDSNKQTDPTIENKMHVHLIKQLNQKYCEQNPNADRHFEKWQ